MSDRLIRLLRQRDLLREHQAWLDEEIKVAADQSGATPLPPAAMRPPITSSAKPAPALAPDLARRPAPLPSVDLHPSVPVFTPPAPPDVDSILKQYRPSPGSVQSELRRGCFIYVAAALVLLVVSITAFFLLMSKP